MFATQEPNFVAQLITLITPSSVFSPILHHQSSLPVQSTQMDILSSMLDLTRRLPPTKLEENVDALMQISPDYADDLSGNVDQPLKLRVDKTTGKEYLACVYNQDGESYRCVTAPFRRVWLCRFDGMSWAVLIDDTFLLFFWRFVSSPTQVTVVKRI